MRHKAAFQGRVRSRGRTVDWIGKAREEVIGSSIPLLRIPRQDVPHIAALIGRAGVAGRSDIETQRGAR
jgi:hypothetical protein